MLYSVIVVSVTKSNNSFTVKVHTPFFLKNSKTKENNYIINNYGYCKTQITQESKMHCTFISQEIKQQEAHVSLTWLFMNSLY